MNVLEIHQLSKSFGNKRVLHELEMKVPENAIFGFVGKNGSGKTTTMKIILGLLRADGGEVLVCGQTAKYGETKTNRHIGYLPDVPEFYGYMTPMEYLSLCGEITGLSKKETHLKGEELLELVGLGDEKRRIKAFSRGMKQRLGVAQALINEPKLLICDEPTSALDPIGRKQILDILLSIKGRTTVLFSTHILSDMERICDYVALLDQGRIALQGTLSEISHRYQSNGYSIEFESNEQMEAYSLLGELQYFDLEIIREHRQIKIKFADMTQGGRLLLKLLSQKDLVPVRMERLEPSLEDLFTEVTQ
ncbi:MAG: ABC transporter ATP-binding protein [Tissierellia bacterium]|nr:ABC transporter ATP-binding protein [Tissierellia bacterium]